MNMEYQERAIDRHFAAFICRQAGGRTGDLFRLVVSLASSAVGKGSSCLDLADLAGQNVVIGNREILLPDLDDLMELMKKEAVVSIPGGDRRPLVLDAAGRLYLFRYWQYERELAGMLLRKAASVPGEIDEAQLHEALLRLFPGKADREEDLQKKAADVALHRLFSAISGGPGTGKTSTVVRILALLRERPGEGKRIALVAPTGKAAARLKASIQRLRSTLNCTEEIREAIPDTVVTIHGLLGAVTGSSRFRHSPDNPLPFDTVIIDEASMVSLPLMHALVSAMPPDARVILLGDPDQLVSIEAGTVFSDICEAGDENPLSIFGQCMVRLEKNFRFMESGMIAELARLVVGGNGGDALKLLKAGGNEGISWHGLPAGKAMRSFLAPRVIDGYRGYLETSIPAEALERFDRFRVLCALREGIYGVKGLDSEIEWILEKEGLIEPRVNFYHGRPVLVTANDYTLRLFNGDCGILLHDRENGGEVMAFFPAQEGGVRSIPPERLPPHETAFAMTVHKSQGSEFLRVLLILPPADTGIITRELVYTGLSRARHSVEVVADEAVFSAAAGKRNDRRSGLKYTLCTIFP